MQALNKNQSVVLKGLKKFYSQFGEMPSIRELQRMLKDEFGLELKSPRSIFIYLNELEKKGLVRRNPSTKVMEILDSMKMMFVNVPLYGSANCGVASIFADQYLQGTLRVSKNILGSDTRDIFAIQASGNSMDDYEISGKKIEDGDYVLIDSKYKPNRGDNNIPVLAVIDGLATIKLLKYLDSDKIGLFPQSKEKRFTPIYITPEDDFIINGKVIEVLKA